MIEHDLRALECLSHVMIFMMKLEFLYYTKCLRPKL